ncbi:SDR family oxidoreductase [Dyella japonica]|uniref:NmrA family transcriptional regulator n=1 Tax=Dyella japonica A8 TaxID=1217721 RepID=A0A075K7R8_9GAMM|nr:SDR family oxidoreductase [Dyella japonica]AIF48183.1 NmrA family transcriptional regulator [Dyella japonica A8]
MKILVIGGTGLIGKKVVARLRKHGHEVVPASPSTGVNTISGEGLNEAMSDADVVVDLSNSPSFEDKAVLDFFEVSGRNLVAAETRAGVKHHVALSVVGTGRPILESSGYFRAKVAQERLIRAAGIPYTIVHATQFFEFLSGIAGSGGPGPEIRISSGLMQPIASDDVADAVADYSLGPAVNGIVEIAGPEKASMAELVQRYLSAKGDPRKVIPDPTAPYFGALLEPDSLLPGGVARLGKQDFKTWFAHSA